MAELGAGRGKGDLDQQHELEVGDAGTLGTLMSLCATKMQDQPQLLSSVLQMLASFMRDSAQTITLDPTTLHPDQTGLNQEDMAELEQLPIDSLIPALASLAAKAKEQGAEHATMLETGQDTKSAQRTNKSLPERVVRATSYTTLIVKSYTNVLHRPSHTLAIHPTPSSAISSKRSNPKTSGRAPSTRRTGRRVSPWVFSSVICTIHSASSRTTRLCFGAWRVSRRQSRSRDPHLRARSH